MTFALHRGKRFTLSFNLCSLTGAGSSSAWCVAMGLSLTVHHVVLSLDLGGLERITLDLLRWGQDHGQAVSVICLERPGILATEASALGARVICLDKRAGIQLALKGRLRRLFEQQRPDVVHTHQIGALFYAGPAARAACVPAVVHTEHGKHYGARLRTRWLGRFAGRYATRFCCVSRDIADAALAHRIVPARKVEVIPNGIDTQRFLALGAGQQVRCRLGIPQGVPVIGTIGRLSEIKRQDLLIRSFARVRAHRPDAHLLLVGDGPLASSLRQLAEECGLNGCVHFAGYQSEPERYLQAMDVFALTSRSEGMPVAILEAAAAGVPVLASRVGGVPEIIEHQRTGLLFEANDSSALTAGLIALLDDPALAGRLAQAARQQAQSLFDVRHMVAGYHKLYSSLLARNGVAV